MRLLGRISLILLAALVVVGAAFGAAKTSFVQNMTPTQGVERRQLTSTMATRTMATRTMATVETGQSSASVGTTDEENSNAGAATPDFHREHEAAGGLFGIMQVFENLLIISLIVLPFAGIPALRHNRKVGPPGGPPPSFKPTANVA